MARKSGRRPRRTREHVIADLSHNHLERQILLCGWAAERVQSDYGFDAMMFTYTITGEVESGVVWFQLKASDAPRYVQRGAFVSVRVSAGHLRVWNAEPMPVVLVVYDASKDIAFWVNVDGVARGRRAPAGGTVSVLVPTANRVVTDGIRLIAREKAGRIRAMQGRI